MEKNERRDPPSAEELEVFHDSLQRCAADGGFYERFYERFLGADPRIPELFANTEMARQRRMLHLSLALIMNLHLRDPQIDAQLRGIAERHDALGIDDELYDTWLDELLATVEERDPRHGDGVEQAWRAVLRRGVAFMHAQRNGH